MIRFTLGARIGALLALAILSGCASTVSSPEWYPAADRVGQAAPGSTARADSLLALAPAQLSEADVAWLRAYAARSSATSPEEIERLRAIESHTRTTALILTAGLLLTVASAVVTIITIANQ